MSRLIRSFKARKLYLDHIALGNSESSAARAAGGTVRGFRRWREEDENFAADFAEAIEEGTDFIEDVATERALKKSDQLMVTILKARRPEKYDRGGKLELSGGISVEGSKAKLLNRIARLQAQGQLSGNGGQEESEVPEAEAPEVPLLPAPGIDPRGTGPARGAKRRAAINGGRAQAS